MPRNMSFTLTRPQMRERSKTVTRRMGWTFLKVGEIVQAVEKCQGLKLGEKVTPIGFIRIASIRIEPLSRMQAEPDYGHEECRREGFPGMSPGDFVTMFCQSHKGCKRDSTVTRIEFEHVDAAPAP